MSRIPQRPSFKSHQNSNATFQETSKLNRPLPPMPPPSSSEGCSPLESYAVYVEQIKSTDNIKRQLSAGHFDKPSCQGFAPAAYERSFRVNNHTRSRSDRFSHFREISCPMEEEVLRSKGFRPHHEHEVYGMQLRNGSVISPHKQTIIQNPMTLASASRVQSSDFRTNANPQYVPHSTPYSAFNNTNRQYHPHHQNQYQHTSSNHSTAIHYKCESDKTSIDELQYQRAQSVNVHPHSSIASISKPSFSDTPAEHPPALPDAVALPVTNKNHPRLEIPIEFSEASAEKEASTCSLPHNAIPADVLDRGDPDEIKKHILIYQQTKLEELHIEARNKYIAENKDSDQLIDSGFNLHEEVSLSFYFTESI